MHSEKIFFSRLYTHKYFNTTISRITVLWYNATTCMYGNVHEMLYVLSHADTSHLRIIKRSLLDITDWQGLGLELDMDDSLLEDIDRDKGGDVEKCKAAMLHAWLLSGRATKSSLVEALGLIGEDEIAAKIV